MKKLLVFNRACAALDNLSPSKAFGLRSEKDQGATGGNPYGGPLPARNRNQFRLHCHTHDFHSQFPTATGTATKGLMNNGKESKATSLAAWIRK